MSKTAMVNFDPAYLEEFAKEQRTNLTQMSLNIGRSRAYLSWAAKDGKVSRIAADYIERLYKGKIDMDRLLMKKQKPKETPAKKDVKGVPTVGYGLTLQVFPEKVVTIFTFNGEEVSRAYSKVRGKKELDLLQAISYSTHMLYKFAEQKELSGEEDA